MVQTTWSNPGIGGTVPTQCDDGQRRYRTEIHAQEVVFLDSARSGSGNAGSGNAQVGDGLPF